MRMDMTHHSRIDSGIMTHQHLLDAYARLTVRTGLNIQQGQQLLITAPLEAVPLVRRITEHAYKAGASLVTTIYADDETTLARYRHAPQEAFDDAAGWLFNGMAEAFVRTIKRDYARVSSLPNARVILQLLPKWFEHYNTVHPHRALGYRSPREFIAERKTR